MLKFFGLNALNKSFSRISITPSCLFGTFKHPAKYFKFDSSTPLVLKQNKTQNRKPKRFQATAEVRFEASTRWLPTARGNLKRLRSNKGHKMTKKTNRRKMRLSRPVYATRSQLNKLKKIFPHGYLPKRR
jgi:ribosomal protein L35